MENQRVHAPLTYVDVLVDLVHNPRYANLRAAICVVGSIAYGVLDAALSTAADYYFIEMVHANVSTSTLLMFRALQRATFD